MTEYQIIKPTNYDGLESTENFILTGEYSDIPTEPGKSVLIIGSQESPMYTFYSADLVSVSGESTVDLVGNELSIDRITPTVRYVWHIKYTLQPTDYDGLISSDGKVICGLFNESLADIPYGTTVWFYDNDVLQGKYYVEHVERTGKEQWAIHGVSVIGLLDVQVHRGGVYTGKTFAELLVEFFGGTVGESENGVTPITGGLADCYVEDEVAITTVHGLLPYATKRENLHQLIFSYVVNLQKTENGDLLFSYLKNNLRPSEIPRNRLYLSGSVRYEQPVTDVELTEYTYVYDDTVEPEEIYDNVSSPHVQGEALVLFSTPVNPETITTSEQTMIVRDANETSAYVTGNGIISAIPFQVQSRVLKRSVENAVIKKAVTVSNVTLVNPLNSNNIMNRLFEYYTQCKTANSSLIVDGEKSGELYGFHTPYDEYATGFIHKMLWNKTSITKANCEIVTNYTPTGVSTNFQNMVLLTGSGAWDIPTGLKSRENPIIRAVLIAGGTGGHGGFTGQDSEKHYDSPGEGGLGGDGGSGGRVFTVDIDVSQLDSISYDCGKGGLGGQPDEPGLQGDDTTFGEYSTYYGAVAPGGIMNLMNGKFYARKGKKGLPGSKGGMGIPMNEETNIAESVAMSGGDGESFTDGEKTWKGGRGSKGNGANSGGKSGWAFGGGGGGAAYGAKGGDATPGHVEWQKVIGGFGGTGATATVPGEHARNIGCGGQGGHGGGGGGAPGDSGWSGGGSPTGYPGKGGKGSQGGKGYDGGILIYY